jgi:hypothetical protein
MMVTKSFGSEVSWVIWSEDFYVDGSVICEGSGYESNSNTTAPDCDLVEGERYYINCTDSYGDGWHGGYLQVGADQVCGDNSSFSST